jgi:nickel-type superoxide dismutase maturation protease
VIGFTTVRIVGPSMAPTLRNGETHLAVTGVRLRSGHVVVIRHPERPGLLTVKRLVRREDDGWWVEGDNAAESTDSRQFGLVDPGLVVARVVMRVRPLRRRS